MKETFDINIVEDDGVTEIANKSGGQVVYLETAIQLAISLVVRKQGREFETAYLDEKDGALDIENAHHYLEMIRKAHALSGVCNTFIITHRPELLNQIPQQILLADGVIEVIN
jgi:DNA repair exonuclease SbcCD ATPase subunit